MEKFFSGMLHFKLELLTLTKLILDNLNEFALHLRLTGKAGHDIIVFLVRLCVVIDELIVGKFGPHRVVLLSRLS